MTPSEINEFAHAGYPAVGRAGIICETAEPGMVVVRWPHDPRELRPGEYISGPTQFLVADVALWFVAFTVVGLESMAVTSDLAITFLRPARGGDLLGRARVVSHSKRRLHGTVELWVGEEGSPLVSHATGTYALPTVS